MILIIISIIIGFIGFFLGFKCGQNSVKEDNQEQIRLLNYIIEEKYFKRIGTLTPQNEWTKVNLPWNVNSLLNTPIDYPEAVNKLHEEQDKLLDKIENKAFCYSELCKSGVIIEVQEENEIKQYLIGDITPKHTINGIVLRARPV